MSQFPCVINCASLINCERNLCNMYEVPDWPIEEPVWTDETLRFLFAENIKEPPFFNLKSLLDKSKKFPIEFPISTVLCKTLKANKVDLQVLERNINSVYPLLHEKVLLLSAEFILHKRKFGNQLEKQFYKNMTILELVQRLFSKRAVCFLGVNDSYWLIDKTSGIGQWEIIGTDQETRNLNLQKCLSYDELKLSAFLSVSSYTYFINDGNRFNCGNPATDREEIEDEGIIVGLIGTRTEKPNVMEYQDIIITKAQNTKESGYGQQTTPTIPNLIAQFYEKPSYTYDYVSTEKKDDENFPRQFDTYFDNFTYAKRLALSIDTLLIEANARAAVKKTSAFVHVVGIGLGVWMIFDHQKSLFLQICARRIETLGEHLCNISDVFFDYFPDGSTCGKYKHGDLIPIPNHPKIGIKVLIGKRNPHKKLTGEHKGKLLVVSYAWDSNALPGNEFWFGSLDGSGDPAAASSTQVAELHNPHINPKVCAHNLRIATPSGILALNEYREKIGQKFPK